MSSNTQACSPPAYDVVVERNMKLPLRDGVQLAMDVYFPAIDGKRADVEFPVILVRTAAR